MSEGPVRYELSDKVAIVHLDDGKANALSATVIASLHDALDRAEKEATALLIIGRPGRLSAGFDLSVMRAGDGKAVASLVTAGAELAMRLYVFPLPVVIACSGHALAMGALLLLSADYRIGAEGDFKIGLNEVAIGMTLPTFGVELARERLSKRHLARAVAAAEIYDPDSAVDAGYLDRVASPAALEAEALKEAQRLAALSGSAHHGTKQRLRGDAVAAMRASLSELSGGL